MSSTRDLIDALQRADRAESKLAQLREMWSGPVEPDSFHIDGFRDKLSQLADLYDSEIASEMRKILEIKS